MWINGPGSHRATLAMAPVIYGCPATRLNVQALIADDPTDADDGTFERVKCAACGCTW